MEKNCHKDLNKKSLVLLDVFGVVIDVYSTIINSRRQDINSHTAKIFLFDHKSFTDFLLTNSVGFFFFFFFHIHFYIDKNLIIDI